MSNKKLVADFAPDRFNSWRLWSRTPASETDSGYSCTERDPVTGIESERAINQSDIDHLPTPGEPLLPATWWFVLDKGTEPQKLIMLAQGQPEMIASVHSQVNLSGIINSSVDGTTPLLEVIEINRPDVVPDLLAIGASPTAEILVDPALPTWTTAFAEALKDDRIRILRHFVEAGLLKPGHLRECQEKYSKDQLDLPAAEAEHVNLLLDAVNRSLKRESPSTRDTPSPGRAPKAW